MTKPSLDTFAEFVRSFERMRSEWTEEGKKLFEKNRHQAFGFNIFRILGVDRLEVKTHSAFLAEILNPIGSHGQGEIFLKSFIQQCQENKCFHIPVEDYVWENWKVDVERAFLGGRMDIVLEYPDPNPCHAVQIVIENKIDASEQLQQLEKYSKWMKTQNKYFAHQVLIYLTVTGEASNYYKRKYARLSYIKDIIAILTHASEGIYAKKVNIVVNQYIQVIRSLDRRYKLLMKSEEELADYLMKKENLKTTLDIAHHIDIVKTKLLHRFWDKVKECLQKELDADNPDDKWELKFRVRDSEKRILTILDDWYGIDIFDGSFKDHDPSLRYTVSQEIKPSPSYIHFAVYKYGTPEVFSSLEDNLSYLSLLEKLKESHPKGPRGKYISHIPRKYKDQRDLLTQLSGSWESVAENIALTAWDNFSNVREAMQKMNDIIRTGL